MTQAGDVSSKGAGAQGAAQGSQQQGGAPQGGGVIDQAKDSVQQFAGQAKDQVTQRAQGVFDQGKQRAAEQLTGVAQTLRQTTDQLKSGGQLAFAAPYLDRGVGQLERLADYVRTADVQDLAQQAERFSRQQPALFLGILFTAGIAGARFLKSSQRDLPTQGSGAGRYPNYGAGYGGGSYGGSSYGSSGSYGSGSYGAGSTSGSSYGGGGTGASSAGGSYTGSTAGSQGATGGYGSGSYGDASGSSASGASSADDERGMDIGPTSSGLRGDI